MSRKIFIKVDSKIHLDLSQFSNIERVRISEDLKEALSIPNPDWVARSRQKLSTYGVDPHIAMWKIDGDDFVMPRGFANDLKKGLTAFGFEIHWKDNRAVLRASVPQNEVTLRQHQSKPLEKLLEASQGMYQAPPGSGKTVVCLELWRRSGQKALVIVDKKNLAKQWQERAREHLGVQAGIVGDGSFDDAQPLTIALVQTLDSKQKELASEWFSQFGMLLVDECHHSSSTSWRSVVESFPAKYRIGVSATPDRENGTYKLAELILGPLAAITKKSELYEDGTILKPTIKVVNTDFAYDYYPTHDNVFGKCGHSNCNQGQKRVHRNNYQQLLSGIAKCSNRTNLITQQIKNECGKAQLVVSKRKSHLQLIAKHILNAGICNVHMLTGSETTDERQYVIDKASEGNIVVLSTLADEALDIPQLEVIHLVWPTRSIPLILQQIGRVERSNDGKSQPVVYDYVDHKIGVLKNQWQERKYRVYSSGYTIELARASIVVGIT